MNKFLALFKADFINSYSLSSILRGKVRKEDKKKILLTLFMILCFLPAYIGIIFLLNSIFQVYRSIGQETSFLVLGFGISQAIMFFLGILFVYSKYYYSKDIEGLLHLPIKSSSIVASKFLTIIISEYLTSLPIVLPFLIIYGKNIDIDLRFIIYSLFLLLLNPIIPMVLASVLVILFIRYTDFGKKKDLLRLVTGLVFIGLIILIQIKINRISSVVDEDLIMELIMKDSNFLFDKLTQVFPMSFLIARSLINFNNIKGLMYFLGFIVINMFSMYLLLTISERLYLEGLFSLGGDIKKKRKYKLSYRRKSIKYAIMKKEILMIVKTPVYFMNSILSLILIPIILIISLSTGSGNPIDSLSQVGVDLNSISIYIAGFLLFVTSSIAISNTSISREGSNFWINQTLPIKAEDQVLGRLYGSLIIQNMGNLIYLIILKFVLNLSSINLLIIFLINFFGGIVIAQIGLLVDGLKPKLIWSNPQEVIKRNFNVMVSLILSSLYLVVVYFSGLRLLNISNKLYLSLFIVAISITSSLILHRILKKVFTELLY